jgi:regulator of cell morphogenesis and NO signaling
MPAALDQPLGDLVTRTPAAARVLDRFGLDYCCRGGRTLDEACTAAGIDATTVAAELDALDGAPEEDWAALPPPALAAHIVATHHAYLREELPLLSALAAKVERVHGGRHPELAEVRALFEALRADLEPHLDKEERVLFPAIRAVVETGRRDFPFGPIANPVHMMGVEHERAGELLERLRRATEDHTVPPDGCASYRSLYERLADLEHDTHMHIHKENHVLFPAAMQAWDRAEAR